LLSLSHLPFIQHHYISLLFPCSFCHSFSPSAIVTAHLRRRHLSGLSTLHLRYSDFSAAGYPRRRTPKTSAEIDPETPYYHQTPLVLDVNDGEGLSLLCFTRMRSGLVSRDFSDVGKAALVKRTLGWFERKTEIRISSSFQSFKIL
jgi:hypothetical protein